MGSWAEVLNRELGKKLPVAEDDSALALARQLQSEGFALAVQDGQLRVTHSSNRALSPSQEEAVRTRRDLLLALLAPRPVYEVPVSWQVEVVLERDMLLRRAAACSNARVRSELLALAQRRPADVEAWALVFGKIKELECRLAGRGQLPLVVYLQEPKS